MDKQNKKDRYNGDLVNEKIRFPEVLVIGPDGESLGKMSRIDAYRKAESYELDLLCVAPQANPPVCKIINYGKYRFDAQKKAKEAKKNQKIIELKEIQLTPQIGQHDIETKVKAAIKFLEDGNKVKVGVRFKGRQMAHPEVGNETLNKFLEYVTDYATIEKKPVLDGRWLTCVLSSKVKK
ncbi:MAG: translation initiation factor IF-3 [bacterium]|nr:translation initiation factor IF-3 [bacterium]MDD7616251.1 translation initiation factor IF-3 [bacterium]